MKKEPEPVRAWTWPHYTFIRAVFLPLLFRLCGGWRVVGQEHVPPEGPALIAANHVSYLDPPAVAAALPRRTYYFAKQELFEIPLFGWFIRHCYAYPVDREGNDKEAFRHAIRLLQAGELLTIFPEGGRSPDGSLQAGRRGAALIAARAGAPIIPCSVWGTDHVLPREAKFLHRGLIQVSFGPAMPTRGTHEQATKVHLNEITGHLMQEIARLRAEQEEWAQGRGCLQKLS